jgi:hypothetical protein
MQRANARMENLSTIKRQLNTPGGGNPMFAGRQLQWPLTARLLNVESTVVKI